MNLTTVAAYKIHHTQTTKITLLSLYCISEETDMNLKY